MRETKAEIEAEEVALRCEVQFSREHGRAKLKNPRKKNPGNPHPYKGGFYIVDKRTGKSVAGPSSVAEADMVLETSAGYSHGTHQVIGGRYLTEHAFKSNPKKKNNPHKKTKRKKKTSSKKRAKKTSSKKRAKKKTTRRRAA